MRGKEDAGRPVRAAEGARAGGEPEQAAPPRRVGIPRSVDPRADRPCGTGRTRGGGGEIKTSFCPCFARNRRALPDGGGIYWSIHRRVYPPLPGGRAAALRRLKRRRARRGGGGQGRRGPKEAGAPLGEGKGGKPASGPALPTAGVGEGGAVRAPAGGRREGRGGAWEPLWRRRWVRAAAAAAREGSGRARVRAGGETRAWRRRRRRRRRRRQKSGNGRAVGNGRGGAARGRRTKATAGGVAAGP